MPTRISHCSCYHLYQDSRYGSQRRIHNATGKSGKGGQVQGWRCTVCGAVKGDNAPRREQVSDDAID